jgi:hypothetical protein
MKHVREIERKEFKKYKGWTMVTCKALCGCCSAEFLFKTEQKAEQVCRESALKHTKITDDRGVTTKVDGFYGFKMIEI